MPRAQSLNLLSLCTHSLCDLIQSHALDTIPNLHLPWVSSWTPDSYKQWWTWHHLDVWQASQSYHVQKWAPAITTSPKQFLLALSHFIFQLLKSKCLVSSLSPFCHTQNSHWICQQIPSDVPSKHVRNLSISHGLCGHPLVPSHHLSSGSLQSLLTSHPALLCPTVVCSPHGSQVSLWKHVSHTIPPLCPIIQRKPQLH